MYIQMYYLLYKCFTHCEPQSDNFTTPFINKKQLVIMFIHMHTLKYKYSVGEIEAMHK